MRISDWSSDVCSSDLEEVEFLEVYLKLEALRFDDDFVYQINVDEELEEDMLEIPAMIIQPFVENAILHGLMTLDGHRKLKIDLVDGRSEERRGGKECVSTCKSRWALYH